MKRLVGSWLENVEMLKGEKGRQQHDGFEK